MCSSCSLPFHVTEEVHDTGKNDQQDTTSRTQSQDLRQETLVQRTKALLPHNRAQRRPRPSILRHTTRNLGRILYPALRHIHRRVQDGADSSTHTPGDEIVAHLEGLVFGRVFGQQRADLEDAAEVAGVPEDVAPDGGLEALVEGQDAFLADDFGDAVEHAVVFGCLRFVYTVSLALCSYGFKLLDLAYLVV